MFAMSKNEANKKSVNPAMTRSSVLITVADNEANPSEPGVQLYSGAVVVSIYCTSPLCQCISVYLELIYLLDILIVPQI